MRHIRKTGLALMAGILLLTGCGSGKEDSVKSIKIGVTLYDQYDTFISELMQTFKSTTLKMESEKGVAISLEILDASGNQTTQNEQVRTLMEKGCDVICVNLVDRTEPTTITDMAEKNNIPIIFFNRELVAEDLERWSELYYVGADATRVMLEATYEHAKKILDAGCKLLTLGGDHTIPYGMVRATSEKYGKLALLHFDSHQDSTPTTDGNVSHANFAYDLQAEGCIDPSHSAQVFIRTEMTECGYNIFHAQDAVFMDMEDLAGKIKAVIGDMPVYLTFDIDALDPSAAPGTGTPVVGGPSSAQVRKLLYSLRGIDVVAADLVEVLPAYDHSEITALAAATIAQDLMYLM